MAFAECMKDLDQADCNLCFTQCKTEILRCLPFQLVRQGGRVSNDRYNFFNESLTPQNRTVCAAKVIGSNQNVFSVNVMELVGNLSILAPKNDGVFSVGSVNRGNVSVYGLAHCWEFVNESACGDCLAYAVSKIYSCPPKEEEGMLNTGCYSRYSTVRFYYNNSSPNPWKWR